MLLLFSCFNAVRCVTYQIVKMTVNVLFYGCVKKKRKEKKVEDIFS